MELYLLRHGIAEDNAPSGRDSDRALTPDGKRKLRDLLKFAAQSTPKPDLILASTYKRAIESAAIAAKVFDYTEAIPQSTALVPNAHVQELWEEVRIHKSVPKLFFASHEPLLSSAAAFLLNSSSLMVDFKKGALMRIDIESFSTQPHGVLKWYLTPRFIP